MEAQKPFDYELFRKQAVRQLRTGNPNAGGIQWLLAPVITDLLEMALLPDVQPKNEAKTESAHMLNEMSETNSKTVSKPSIDAFERNWRGRQDIRKNSIERKVLFMFECGISYRSIQKQLLKNFNEVIKIDDLRKITDQLLPQMDSWQQRPLQPIYVCLWVSDKVSQLWVDSKSTYQTIYSVIAVDLHGNRDVLGHYIDSRNMTEFWPDLLTNLKSRGVNDVLM